MIAAAADLLLMTLASSPAASVPPFGPGEELVFQIKALGLRAGNAQFDVGAATEVHGSKVWPILMVAHSEGMTETVYPIRDRFVTFWDPAMALPVEAQLQASEGGRHHTMSIHFVRDEPAHAVVNLHENGKDPVSSTDPMPATAQDFQAAVYWLRTRPLQVGDREEVPIVAGKQQWIMMATVASVAPLDVPAGHFDAVEVAVTTSFGGKLQSRGRTVGYFSADARHLPLRFEADLSLGKMVAELVRFSPGQ